MIYILEAAAVHVRVHEGLPSTALAEARAHALVVSESRNAFRAALRRLGLQTYERALDQAEATPGTPCAVVEFGGGEASYGDEPGTGGE